MMSVKYRIGWQGAIKGTHYFYVTVAAKSISAGFEKAAIQARNSLSPDHKLTKIEFWERL